MPLSPRVPPAHRTFLDVLGASIVLAIVAVSPARADFAGRVVAVNDGDTLTVLVNRTQYRVRLVGIDAPERGQPYGNVARRALADRVDGRDVHVVERGRDVYGRVLGRVYADGVDVNAEQVRAGYAWVFRRHADPRLVALEDEARAARRGLWSETRPVAPWHWRREPARSPSPSPGPAA